jgi:beta-phosphoglucomutase
MSIAGTGDNDAVSQRAPHRPGSTSAVVFDFDGVLADTEGLHLRAFQDVFRRRRWQLDEAAYFDRYLGYDDRGLVIAYAKEHDLQLETNDVRDLVEAKSRVFAGYVEAGDVLFSGASDCVRALAEHYVLGIASGALRAEIVAILDAAGLTSVFRVIVAADDVTECKPSPVPYLSAAAGLGIEPRQCVAVEDSAAGLEAARVAGMRTVGITTTLPRHLLAGADRIIDSLRDLSPALVEGLREVR